MRLQYAESTHGIPPRRLQLLGNCTGLIKDLLWYLPDRSDPDLFYVTVDEADLEPLTGTVGMGLDAGGTGLTPENAVLSAIGEAAERYCLLLPDHEALIEGTYREVARRACVPDYSYLQVFSKAQAGTAGLGVLTRDTRIQWQPATNLLSGQTVFVPAQFVWLDPVGETRRYYPTTSNGTACAASRPVALRRALAEYLERDAIMRAWYKRRPTQRINFQQSEKLGELVTERFESEYLSMASFRVASPTDIPVIGSAVIEPRERVPKIAFGGACALSSRAACRAALIEAAQTWVFLKDRLAAAGMPTDIDPDDIFNLTDNLLYYADSERYGDVEWFLGSQEHSPIGVVDHPTTDRGKLTEYLTRCRHANLTPLAVDVTAPDIQQVGLCVTRVIIPELLDLALPSLPPQTHPVFRNEDITAKPHPYP